MMQNSNPDVALALLLPGCRPVQFDRFSTLIPPKELGKIEGTLSLKPPNDNFRAVLIPILYRFYIRALSADAMVSRKALQADLQKASSLTVELETLMTRIWRSREPTIVPLLAPRPCT
jgi:hypothetical protein